MKTGEQMCMAFVKCVAMQMHLSQEDRAFDPRDHKRCNLESAGANPGDNFQSSAQQPILPFWFNAAGESGDPLRLCRILNRAPQVPSDTDTVPEIP